MSGISFCLRRIYQLFRLLPENNGYWHNKYWVQISKCILANITNIGANVFEQTLQRNGVYMNVWLAHGLSYCWLTITLLTLSPNYQLLSIKFCNTIVEYNIQDHYIPVQIYVVCKNAQEAILTINFSYLHIHRFR